MSAFTLKQLQMALNLTKSNYSKYLNEPDFDDIFRRIHALIENQTFQNLIVNAQLFKEQALVFNHELKIIDLLIYKNNTYYIVDYKTTKEQLQEHVLQVKHYKKAIKTIYPKSDVEACVIYLHQNQSILKKVI
jgi:exodeoxyribonuclease V beta subunit